MTAAAAAPGADAVWSDLRGDAGAAAGATAGPAAQTGGFSAPGQVDTAGPGFSGNATGPADTPGDGFITPGTATPAGTAAGAGAAAGSSPSRGASADAEHSAISAAERENMYRMYSHHVEVNSTAVTLSNKRLQ